MNEFGDDTSLEPMKDLSKNKYDVYSRCKLLFIGLSYFRKNNIQYEPILDDISKKVSVHIFAIEKNVYNKLSHKLRLEEIYHDNSILIEDMISLLDTKMDNDGFTGPLLQTPLLKEELARLNREEPIIDEEKITEDIELPEDEDEE